MSRLALPRDPRLCPGGSRSLTVPGVGPLPDRGAQWHGGDNRRVNLNQKLSTGVIQRPSPQTIELLQEDWRAIEAVLRTSS